MTITKSENRYHAEQQTPVATFHGFGNTASAAVNEALGKINCPVCGFTLKCMHCFAAKGARAANSKLTKEEMREKMRKAGVASGAKRQAKPVLRSSGEEPPKVGAQKAPDGASSAS